MSELEESLRRRNLVIIALLPQMGLSRHKENRLTKFGCSNDRAYTSVRDDHVSFSKSLTKLYRGKKVGPPDVARWRPCAPYLREDVARTGAAGPGIYYMHQSIKGLLSANRNKDHRIEPA